MQFYDKFIGLCNNLGKSPSRIALEIGASKPSVTRWKNGSIPSDAVMKKIADYFGVTVAYLKGEEDTITVDGISITPEEKKLLELIKMLTEDEVKQARDYLAFLVSMRKK